jgi:two-component system response regulator HydG
MTVRPPAGPRSARSGAGFDDLVVESPALRALVEHVARLARSRLPLLITGPSGSGKSRFARTIHAASGRVGRFEVVDLPALAGPLLPAELFGAVRGAYTGAERDRRGAFERAHGGTLFLDEIGDCPLPDQARMLTVLEQGAVRPLGGERAVPIDVRVVAATAVDLEARVADGRFRRDLWFRLRGDVLRIPSLSERPEDVVPLARDWLARHAPEVLLSEPAADELRRRPWPGELRELLHAVERAAALCDGVIEPAHLPVPPVVPCPCPTTQREVMRAAVARCGSERAAARALGVPWSTWKSRKERLGGWGGEA